MKKPNKQVQIDFIISCLKNGEQRGKILVKAGKKWGTSKSSFDRLLKIAKEQYSVTQASLKAELEEVDKQAAIEARKKAIMTAEERKEYLTKIILGEVKIPKTEIRYDSKTAKFETIDLLELPNHQSRINAISELNKMYGDYAPTKVANTDKDGNDVKQPPVISITAVNTLPIEFKEH